MSGSVSLLLPAALLRRSDRATAILAPVRALFFTSAISGYAKEELLQMDNDAITLKYTAGRS